MADYGTKDSGKRVVFASGMRRDTDEGKPRFDLLYWPLILRWAELMARGAVKYGDGNWQLANSPEERDRFKASLLRHLYQYLDGQRDEDHAAAILYNIGALEYLRDARGLDLPPLKAKVGGEAS